MLDDNIDVTYGPHSIRLPSLGFQIGDVSLSLKDVLNLPEKPEAFVNGFPMPSNYKLRAGDRLEYMRVAGGKRLDVLSKDDFLDLFGGSEKDWQDLVEAGLEHGELPDGTLVVGRSEVRRCIQLNPNMKPHEITCGKVRVKLEENVVLVDGKSFVLDDIYIAILHELVKANGRSVTRAQLREHPKLAAEERLDRVIQKLSKSHPMIGRHIQSDRLGYRIE